MELINLEDWEKTGEGAFGESYFNRHDSNLMLKMMFQNADVSALKEELEVSRSVYDLGLPTPEPGHLVSDGKRTGIVFKRLLGKESYARAVCDHPEQIEALAFEYASAVKMLHTTPCPQSGFRSVRKIYENLVIANNFRSTRMKDSALRILDSIPEMNMCIHGDLHFGNVLRARGKSYFIDLGSFGYGNPLLDWGMQGFLMIAGKYYKERFIFDYHCTYEQALQFWHFVLKDYFGQDINPAVKQEELLPFIAVRTFTTEPLVNIRYEDNYVKDIYVALT